MLDATKKVEAKTSLVDVGGKNHQLYTGDGQTINSNNRAVDTGGKNKAVDCGGKYWGSC